VRIRNSLVPTLAAPIAFAVFSCSSVKQEKGPFKDDDFDPWPGSNGATTTTGDPASSAGGAGSGTGGTGNGGTTTTTGAGGAGGTGMGTGAGGAGAGGSGIGGAGACQTFDYKNYEAPPAKLTLKADILPIFTASTSSCTLSVCHSDKAPNPPKLGPSTGTVDAAGLEAIRNSLLGASTQVPSLKLVSPGKPEESYLMNKIDGTFGCMGFKCQTAAGCGERMPQLLPALAEDKINKVRDWIKQGAAAM
jgi:hypothetical protein